MRIGQRQHGLRRQCRDSGLHIIGSSQIVSRFLQGGKPCLRRSELVIHAICEIRQLLIGQRIIRSPRRFDCGAIGKLKIVEISGKRIHLARHRIGRRLVGCRLFQLGGFRHDRRQL